jgi:Rps23 Pro-64 3,4-dihydroxylase Tpa1-like proline 4-hydroxylase
MNKEEISNIINKRLSNDVRKFNIEFKKSGSLTYCVIDDLLPIELALRIFHSFPNGFDMMVKKSLREFKYVAAQMDHYDPILESAIYAFQEPSILAAVEKITDLKNLVADDRLYAGGISLMGRGMFLNPHIDNSHNNDRSLYRVLNLLYYVEPDSDLKSKSGGNLELWPNGVSGEPVVIESRFNRLVIMATHQTSLHSVSPITADRFRSCVSNYYFSENSFEGLNYFHVTSFRGRPDQAVRDFLLRVDSVLRMLIRKISKNGITKTKHIYRKK